MEQKASTLPESALIIEDDEILANMVRTSLIDLGIKSVDSYNDGAEGLAAARGHPYQIVLLDWMIPQTTGLAVFNQLKNSPEYYTTPILVMSGMINKKDFSILGDFPLATLIEKPFQVSILSKQVVALYREGLWYQSQREAIATFFTQLEGDIEVSNKFYDYVLKAPNPYPLALIAGRFLKHQGRYPEAERFIKLAVQGKDSGLMALNELAKLYLMTGRDREAKNLLKKAQELSPSNIERICDLGSISLKEMDTKTASNYFRMALGIDRNAERAKDGNRLVSNIDGWLQSAQTIPHNYASLLNAIGINFVRQKAFAEGFSHYKSALAQIFDSDTKSRIGFNLGLGYAKQKNYPEALMWLKNAYQLKPDFEKARKYVEILERLVSGGGDKKTPKNKEPQPAQGAPAAPRALETPPAEPGPAATAGETAQPNFLDTDDYFESIDETDGMAADPNADFHDREEPATEGLEGETTQQPSALPDAEKLKAACPQIDEFYKILIKDGIYLQGQIPLLSKLLAQHGEVAFNQVVTQAIKGQITSILALSGMFANLKNK